MEISDNQPNKKKLTLWIIYSYKRFFWQIIGDILEFWKENIRDWFRIQIIYLNNDIQKKAFHRKSEDYDRAWQNLTLLFRKNLIIILLVCGPLAIIPIPWTAELGIYFYYRLIKLLPEDIQKRLRLEFQTREDLPPAKVYANLKWKIPKVFEGKTKIKKVIIWKKWIMSWNSEHRIKNP